MKSILISATLVGLLALSGCSTPAEGIPAVNEPTIQTSFSPVPEEQAESIPAEGTTPDAGAESVVIGEIAAVDTGTLQVQGSDTQTAVRYDDSTTLSGDQTVDAGSILAGDCITGTVSDGSALQLTLTEAIDGSCRTLAAPPGGARGDASGDAPERSASPRSGGTPGGGGRSPGNMVSGVVIGNAESALTVEVDGQSQEIALTSETTVMEEVTVTDTELAVGLCVTARGTGDALGGMDATSLQLTDPDAEGNCSANTRRGARNG